MSNKPEPYYTLWEVVEKWATETSSSPMDVLKILRRAVTYPEPPTAAYPEAPPPPLIIWPIAYFSAKGEISRTAVSNATKMVEVIDGNGKISLQSQLYTREYRAAVEFLNSAKCPPQPTDEVKDHLSQFAVLRKDFQKWCALEGYPLPAFWFNASEKGRPLVISTKAQRNDLMRHEIEAAIEDLNGDVDPKRIMKKLKGYAGNDGSCIVEATVDGVRWKDLCGNTKRLDQEALNKRLSRRRTISR